MSSRAGRPLVIAAAAGLFVAILGGSMTRIGPWYEGLAKPEWNPPGWLFAPVWALIYALAVFAAVRGWRAMRTPRERAWLLSLFFVNGVLNIAWTALFFTVQRPDWALAEVGTLWLSILALIVFIGRRDRPAAGALVPYFVWVGFAGLLNARLVMLNAPFG